MGKSLIPSSQSDHSGLPAPARARTGSPDRFSEFVNNGSGALLLFRNGFGGCWLLLGCWLMSSFLLERRDQ